AALCTEFRGQALARHAASDIGAGCIVPPLEPTAKRAFTIEASRMSEPSMIDCRFGLSALQPCSRNSPESAQMAGQTTSMSIRALSIALIAAAVALAGGTSPAVAKKRTPAPKLSLSDPAAPAPGDGKVPDAAAAQSAAAPSSEARPGPQAVTEEIAEPAKKLFAEKELPSIGKAAAIGYYPRGCLRGGVELPSTGATWQVMRISRNR